MSDALMMPHEVAALFNVRPKTVRRWELTGKVTAIRTPGGHRRYRASEVRALLGDCPPDEELLTTRQVADQFRVCTDTVRRWAHAGRLTLVRTPQGQCRYRPPEVRALLAEAQQAGATEADQ